MGRLEGKVAVITGAASGIGLATLERFAAEGAKIVAADVQEEKGRALQEKWGNQVKFVRCDVASESDLKHAIAMSETIFGGLDILFNNAGYPGPLARLEDISSHDWDHAFAVLLRSVALGMREAVPLMRKNGGGSIINTSSSAGLRVGYAPVAYTVAKAAVIQLSKVAASELGQDNIRVNTIIPGLVATPIFGHMVQADRETSDLMVDALKDRFVGRQSLPRSGIALDIANAAVFLSSEESSWITGLDMIVDGGLLVRPSPDMAGNADNSLARIIMQSNEIALQNLDRLPPKSTTYIDRRMS